MPSGGVDHSLLSRPTAATDANLTVVEREPGANARLLLRVLADVGSAKGHLRLIISDTALAFAVGSVFSWP